MAASLLVAAGFAAAQAPPDATPAPASIVEINVATEAELDSIRGIGPPMTRALLAARGERPFADWADLMRRVKGIGPARARQWSADGLRVQSAAYTLP